MQGVTEKNKTNRTASHNERETTRTEVRGFQKQEDAIMEAKTPICRIEPHEDGVDHGERNLY